MDTLSIFCLGTSHADDEQWRLMRALYDLTDAAPLDQRNLVRPWPQAVTADHVKIVIDGTELFRRANAPLDRNANLVCSLIADARPGAVNLFGHSRGALLCCMIAARMFHAPFFDTRRVYNLWLIDIVERTNYPNPPLKKRETLSIYGNVDHLVRVVMEDVYYAQLRGLNSVAPFPLEEIRVYGTGRPARDHLERAKQVIPTIELIRLPGHHGSGCEVNPVAGVGSTLPPTDITNVDLRDVWPIGGVCLATALDHLSWWGTPLIGHGTGFLGPRGLIEAYSRIRIHNRRVANGKIDLNLAATGRTGEPQTRIQVKPKRDPVKLGRYGTNFSQNRVIVNEQHRELWKSVESEEVAATLTEIGSTSRRELSVADQPSIDGQEARDLLSRHRSTRLLLGTLGVTSGGQPL